ncbi:MAG TPA: hypothetical protein P5107_05810 [Thermotogota bacterium]|nr:hypothetical protein [Thermotogota bacterium]HRW34548.1 hypothetical protein [Thermotogota bacterium]
MKKIALLGILVLVLFSLSGCVVFQKVMDVSGTWILEIEESGLMTQIRSLMPENDLTSRAEVSQFLILKIDQTGNTLKGSLFEFIFKYELSGTIGEDDQIVLEVELPSDIQERVSETVTLELTCKAEGNKTLFNKQATKLADGELASSSSPGNPTSFEGTKY